MKKEKLNFTAFVIEAVKNYIRAAKYKDGINTSFGAWKDDEHPELKSGTDNYIRDIRKSRTFRMSLGDRSVLRHRKETMT